MRSRSRGRIGLLLCGAALAVVTVNLPMSPLLAEVPTPSIYPISWQLKFQQDAPRRVVLDIPGKAIPQAYWYVTYTVTNDSGKEQTFYPIFELLTKDGKVIRSDNGVPSRVFDQIKKQEKKQFLEPYPQIAGEIRLGEDQARDGVAIWPEPASQMGEFTLFIGGLSGEIKQLTDDKGEMLKGPDGMPVILRKTLQLDYVAPGTTGMQGEPAQEVKKDWVMR